MATPNLDPVQVSSSLSSPKVRQSTAWLLREAAKLPSTADHIDWVLSEDHKVGRAVDYHFAQLRAPLVSALWERDLFVGVTVIDELIFSAARRGANDIVLDVLQWLAASQVTKPGYIIYPLHSFGIKGAGLFPDPNERSSESLARAFGFAISAQHNSMNALVDWLGQVHGWFGIAGDVPVDLLTHWRRSRAPWLEYNPLIAMRVNEMSGDYFENQRLILDRLKATTAFLAGLSVRQPLPEPGAHGFSSSRVNNHATLDIHHYFNVSSATDAAGALIGSSVPMNVDVLTLAELSELAVDLDLGYWDAHIDDARTLWTGLEDLAKAQIRLRAARVAGQKTKRDTTAGKIFTSVDYFRRSLNEHWSAPISLGTAFEMLLTSKYESGVTNRLARRVEAITQNPTAGSTVRRIYGVRSALVHEGEEPTGDSDVHEAQLIYLLCLEWLVPRIATVPANADDPLRLLTNDPGVDRRRSVMRLVGTARQAIATGLGRVGLIARRIRWRV